MVHVPNADVVQENTLSLHVLYGLMAYEEFAWWLDQDTTRVTTLGAEMVV